jgi:hypothetical protein
MSMVLACAVPSEVAETSLTSKVSESDMKITPSTWVDVNPVCQEGYPSLFSFGRKSHAHTPNPDEE